MREAISNRGKPLAMRRRPIIVSLLLVLAVAGCAGDLSGPDQLASRSKLDEKEMAADCKKLTELAEHRLREMAPLPAQAKLQRESAPPTVTSFFTRAFSNPRDSMPAYQTFRREKAHIEALNGALVAKGCKPVPVDWVKLEKDLDGAK
jgi:hypothetical protein